MSGSASTTWIRGNHRLMWLSLAFPGMLLLLGSGLLVWGLLAELTIVTVLGGVILATAVLLTATIARTGRLPRIELGERSLNLYLPGPRPYEVPLDLVECFFLGTGVTPLPGDAKRDVQTRNIVVRLAERTTDWQHREMPLSMGKWCEGYVTIRGLYCEPIDVGVVSKLNALLHNAQQALKAGRPATSATASPACSRTTRAIARNTTRDETSDQRPRSRRGSHRL
ncbi:MAG: hypothetical protein QM811_19420 [Pirellulales bacterium]